MLLEPRVTAAGAGNDHLVAQTAQGPQFRRVVAQLASRVVDLDLQALGVGLVHVLFQFVGAEEGVVDVRVDVVAVMDVDHVRARLDDLIGRVVGVVVTRGPVAVGVQELERCEQERKVEMKRLAGCNGARAAGRPQHDATVRLLAHRAAAASFVVPGGGQIQRQVTIVDVDQRPPVVFAE